MIEQRKQKKIEKFKKLSYEQKKSLVTKLYEIAREKEKTFEIMYQYITTVPSIEEQTLEVFYETMIQILHAHKVIAHEEGFKQMQSTFQKIQEEEKKHTEDENIDELLQKA